MPEAVVVATARSPIGRAFKGSLTSIRPDDLTAQMITAALAKVPQLDPDDIEDLLLGCGLPGGEQQVLDVIRIALGRSEEHTSELQSPDHLVSPLLLHTKKVFRSLPKS